MIECRGEYLGPVVVSGLVAGVGGVSAFVDLWSRMAQVNGSFWKWRAVRKSLGEVGLHWVDPKLLGKWVGTEPGVKALAQADDDQALIDAAARAYLAFLDSEGRSLGSEPDRTASQVVEVLLRHLTEITDFELTVRSELKLDQPSGQ